MNSDWVRLCVTLYIVLDHLLREHLYCIKCRLLLLLHEKLLNEIKLVLPFQRFCAACLVQYLIFCCRHFYALDLKMSILDENLYLCIFWLHAWKIKQFSYWFPKKMKNIWHACTPDFNKNQNASLFCDSGAEKTLTWAVLGHWGQNPEV